MLNDANGNLTGMALFANAHGKPMAFPEWGDNFGDGVAIKLFANWLKSRNFVAMSYWDSDGGLQEGYGCALVHYPADQAAFKAAWGGTKYTGSYWKLIPFSPNP
jgi:hypothetical protein